MPTTVTRYVNTNSTAGGNGTTNATTGANRAYALLRDALDAEFIAYPNLVTSDIILKVICAGGVDTSGTLPIFEIPAFTTDETRYLHVVADTGSRATAVWDINKYILTHTGGTSAVVFPNAIKVSKWEGLQIENRSTNGVWSVINANDVGQDSILTVDGCYIRSISGSGNNNVGINLNSTGGIRRALRVSNTIVHGDFATGIACNFAANGSSGSYYYNNTVFGNFINQGILLDNLGTGVTGSVKNNIVSGSGGNGSYFLDAGSGQILTATNISSDATSPQTTLRNINSRLFFVSTASGDFRITGGAAVDAGTNLSTDPIYAFSTDINGTTRPVNGTWDIGAYEFVPTIPGVLGSFNQVGIGTPFSLTQNPNLGTFVNIVRV